MGHEGEHHSASNTYEVTEFAPNRRIALEADTKPARHRIFYEVQPVKGGGTQITIGEEAVTLVWLPLIAFYVLYPLAWAERRWADSRKLRRIRQRLESA